MARGSIVSGSPVVASSGIFPGSVPFNINQVRSVPVSAARRGRGNVAAVVRMEIAREIVTA